jgi:FAD/FMN-containing dehydrogenase
VSLVNAVAIGGPLSRAALATMLRLIERAIPTNTALESFIREHHPDLLLVTPLIELGSQQVDYVKCARRLGIRIALCVASWDNLTSKGLIRVVPDHVIVWNEAQKSEAVSLHGVDPGRVAVTGAQLFDHWFEDRPSRSREEFCRTVGLDPARPFVLYVGSSTFIAPDEVPFAERWIARLRGSREPAVAGAGVLIRPHPANSRQWRAFETPGLTNVAIWPPIGTDPTAPDFRRDYFDTLYYCAAVVGINTSAQIEASIVDRPVFTIRAPEFAHAQEGTLHFRYLVNDGGAVRVADTLDEHVAQLAKALSGAPDAARDVREFVRSFVRPHGLDVPVAPVFARTVADLTTLPQPAARRVDVVAVVLRPAARVMASVARMLAEDRPLWAYVLRPFVTTGV